MMLLQWHGCSSPYIFLQKAQSINGYILGESLLSIGEWVILSQ